MRAILQSEPCHNFSVMNTIYIEKDPRDLQEKIVFSNYAAEGAGSILILNPKTGVCEQYQFPDDAGAWALFWMPDRGELLVGTCDHFGSLHCFDMKERRFVHSCRLEQEMYLWNFALGGDGCIYAGTFPGCVLVRFNPVTRELTNLGRVGDCEENQYSRFVFTTSTGDIAVSIGFNKKQSWLYRVQTSEWVRLGTDGDSVKTAQGDFICLENTEGLRFVNAVTLETLCGPFDAGLSAENLPKCPDSVRDYYKEILHPKMPDGFPKNFRGISLKDGRIVGIKGQEYYIWDCGTMTYHNIPAEAPATAIMTVTAVGNKIWGSAENGQTLFCFDPSSNQSKNTNAVTNAGGEVYGIAPLDGKLYLTAYCGGDHVVYDPSQPWNQRENQNPKTLRSVAPEMIRPNGKSVVGPDGAIWTGWYANYGSFGGGISRIDPQTQEVQSWFNLIEDQAIEHIASGANHLFAVTSGSASGMADREDQFYLLQLSCDGEILKKHQFEDGKLPRKLAVTENRIYVILWDRKNREGKVEWFDEDTLEFMGEFSFGTISEEKTDNAPTELLPLSERLMLVFTYGKILILAVPDGKILCSCPTPDFVQTCTRTADGTVWFASKKRLYRIEIED